MTKLRFIIFFAAILFLFGCDKKESKVENKFDLKIDPVLSKVSTEAGVIYTTIKLYKDLSCVVVDTPAMNYLKSLGASNENKKWVKGFSIVKEKLYATGGVYEKNYFYYLCGLDNAFRKCVARVSSRKGQLSWIR